MIGTLRRLAIEVELRRFCCYLFLDLSEEFQFLFQRTSSVLCIATEQSLVVEILEDSFKSRENDYIRSRSVDALIRDLFARWRSTAAVMATGQQNNTENTEFQIEKVAK